MGCLVVDNRLDNSVPQPDQDTSGAITHSLGEIQISASPMPILKNCRTLFLFQSAYDPVQKKPGVMIARKKREIIIPELPLVK